MSTKITIQERNQKRLLEALNLRLVNDTYHANEVDFYRELLRQSGYFFDFGQDEWDEPRFFIIHPFTKAEYLKKYGCSHDVDYPESMIVETKIYAKDLLINDNLSGEDKTTGSYYVYYQFFEGSKVARALKKKFHYYLNLCISRYRKRVFPLLLKVISELGDDVDSKKRIVKDED